ncbi:MAG: redoxin domain-containing protein [Planctomycetota bacterium]|jgi:protocatechuate 3,4-dioxygenase beta subunit
MQTTTYRLVVVLISLCVCGLNAAKENNKLIITGRVVDYLAKPVEGAEVAIYEGDHRNGEYSAKMIAPIGRTNQQGHFELQADVSSQYNTFVVARKEGLALARDGLNYSSNTKGKGHFFLVLEKACTLTGIVVDHNGSPVSGARVQALPKTSYMSRLRQRPMYGPREWLTTETDSHGVFCFDQFAADVSSDFCIKAPALSCTYKFTTHYQNCCGFEVWRSDIRLVLPQEARIKGRVVEGGAGRPVGSVELTIQADRDREDIVNRYYARTVVADADGMFVCTGLPEGKHKIELATLENETAQWVTPAVELNVIPDESIDDIQVSVERGGIIECIVREYGTERPLSQMPVSAYNETFRATSTTDEKGTARFRVLPGDYQASADGQGHIYWRVNDPVAVKEGEVSHVDIVLEKSPTISGSVTDANEHPAEDMLVTVHPFGDHVYTDREGRFVAGYEKRRTEQGLCIMARDLGRSLAAVARTKELKKPVQLSLGPASIVKGRITDPNGIGIPAARVSLCVDFANCLSKIGAEVLADEQGRFEFKAIVPKRDAFNYRISVHAAGFAPRTYDRISIEAEPGTAADVGAIQLMPANLSISGIVVDANGLPAARVPIFLQGADGTDQPDKSTATDDKGCFAIKRICKGPLRLQANFSSSPGGSGFLHAEGGDQNVKIVLGQKRVHRPYVSLVGKPLPELKDLKIELSLADANDKMILICFWDMDQRPSRRMVRELGKRARELKGKGVAVVCVQASKVDKNALDEWAKKYNISFPVGMIEGDEEKIRFSWGVKSLPWLILTDEGHVVTAEGFGLEELDDRIDETENGKK